MSPILYVPPPKPPPVPGPCPGPPGADAVVGPDPNSTARAGPFEAGPLTAAGHRITQVRHIGGLSGSFTWPGTTVASTASLGCCSGSQPSEAAICSGAILGKCPLLSKILEAYAAAAARKALGAMRLHQPVIIQ